MATIFQNAFDGDSGDAMTCLSEIRVEIRVDTAADRVDTGTFR